MIYFYFPFICSFLYHYYLEFSIHTHGGSSDRFLGRHQCPSSSGRGGVGASDVVPVRIRPVGRPDGQLARLALPVLGELLLVFHLRPMGSAYETLSIRGRVPCSAG